MRRRRTKRKRSRKQLRDADATGQAYRAFTPGVLGSNPRRPMLRGADAIRQRTGLLPREFRVRFPGAPFCAPVVQRIKTLGYGPRNPGSNPGGGVWAVSSVELEHVASTHGVEGSNPSRPVHDGRLAQLGEQVPYKHKVTGSTPVLPMSCREWTSADVTRVDSAGSWFLRSASPPRGVQVSASRPFAGVARRSSSCLPSSRNGFDSRHPLVESRLRCVPSVNRQAGLARQRSAWAAGRCGAGYTPEGNRVKRARCVVAADSPIFAGIAHVGRAPAFQAEGRRFDSGCPLVDGP